MSTKEFVLKKAMRSSEQGTSIEFLIGMSLRNAAQNEARHNSGRNCSTPSSGGARVKM